MVDFRKSFLLLAVILLASSMAYGQALTCTASAGNTPIVRAEGLADFVGDVFIICTGGTPTAFGNQVPTINFRIFMNTQVTSALLAGTWSESILTIDDPGPSFVNPVRDAQNLPQNDGVFLKGIGSGFNGGGIDYKTPGNPINQTGPGQINGQTEVYNVFQGQVVADNQIEWRGVPVDPPGTNQRTIRITNVRANGRLYGVSGGLVPSQLTMFISATGTTQFPINQPTQVVATVLRGLEFSVINTRSFLQCNSEPQASNLCEYDMLLKYEELFPTAFKPDDPVQDSDIFGETGKFQASESNYRNVLLDGVFGGPSGLATQGTRHHAQFNNLQGVGVRVWAAEIESGYTGSLACGYDGPNSTATAEAGHVGGANSSGRGGTPSRSNSWVGLGGDEAATWEVLIEDNQAQVYDVYYYGVDIFFTSNTTAGIPALGTATVTGSYAPLGGPNVATSRGSAGHPRFDIIQEDAEQDLYTINSCATSILWPYVVNQSGFDTGMVISNTSLDPWGDNVQQGACRIHYYGSGPGGGAAPDPVDTPMVEGGEYAIWLLSSGGEVRPAGSGADPGGSFAGAPGFEGYVIAICQFQYAHGYAFITRNGAVDLAQGYIPLILDGPADTLPRSGSQSEPLNQ